MEEWESLTTDQKNERWKDLREEGGKIFDAIASVGLSVPPKYEGVRFSPKEQFSSEYSLDNDGSSREKYDVLIAPAGFLYQLPMHDPLGESTKYRLAGRFKREQKLLIVYLKEFSAQMIHLALKLSQIFDCEVVIRYEENPIEPTCIRSRRIPDVSI